MESLKSNFSELIIEETLSAGTFAEVYKGVLLDRQQNPQVVAVKVMKKKWIENKDLINRLEDEANLLNQLQHPNIISALGFIEIEGRPAIVMELIQGIDLQKILKTSSIPPKVAFLIASRVAAALRSAYTQPLPNSTKPLSVIHRDIKPSNIMLTQNRKIKVLDFGASRSDFVGRKGQTTVFQFGSPKYMSNERKKGDRGSHGSDVYSLGIMLIEMLSGKLLEQLPPNSQNEHKLFIQQLLGTIDFGLPNLKWELAAKQVIDRMCAFWKMHRINAEQCIDRLQKFSDNASGESIESFWTRVVRPLSQQMHSNSKSGFLTGRRIVFQPAVPTAPAFVPATTRASDPPQNPVQTPPAADENTQNHPQETITHESPPFRLSKERRLLLYGVIAASVSFSVLNVITFIGLAIAKNNHNIFSQTPPVEPETKPPEPSPQEKMVVISIEREIFSSAKLKDANGKKVLAATRRKTEAQKNLSPGQYRLEVKYVGDAKTYKKKYFIDQDVEIYCGQSDGVASNCIDHNREVILDRNASD
ncbi:MAG: serine/threonine-protein kinase [Myxococcota bacterium]|nr:serine/threonine-protein kinase [Myxococcota bacterium]